MFNKELLPEGWDEFSLVELNELKSSLREQALNLRAKEAPTAVDHEAALSLKEALGFVNEKISSQTKTAIADAFADLDESFESDTSAEEIVAEVTESKFTEDEISETEDQAVAEASDEALSAETEAVEAEVEAEESVEAALDSSVTEEVAEVEAVETEVALDADIITEPETEDAEAVVAEAEAVVAEAAEAEAETAPEAEAAVEAELEVEAAEVVETIEEPEVVEATLESEEKEEEVISEVAEAELEIAETDITETETVEEAAEEVAEAELSDEATEEAEIKEEAEIALDEDVAAATVADEATDTTEESQTMSEKTEGALDGAEFFVPSESASPRSSVIATAGATTKNVGDAYSDMGELALEVGASWKRLGGERGWANVAQGANEHFSIASFATNDSGETPTLSTMSEDRNYQAFDEAISNFNAGGNALTASGGLCAPFEQSWSFFRLAQAQNPVEAAFPTVNASRGGIRWMRPVDFSLARAAITTVSAAQDAAGYVSDGGTTADKPCPVVACPPVDECSVTAVPYCVKWGNFNYYTFPELVENYMRDLFVNYAKVKEVFYLDALSAASTAVTATAPDDGAVPPVNIGYGASRTVIGELRRAAVNYRKRHNMNVGSTLQVILPDWSLDVIKQDMLNDHSLGLNNIVVDNSLAARIFTDLGLSVSFYYDTTTAGSNQSFAGAQAAGELNNYPAQLVSYMFAPGTFVRLSGGALDFGLIRDSSLIRTNDLIVAAEEFTGLCKVGYESLKITHDICASGAGPLGVGKYC